MKAITITATGRLFTPMLTPGGPRIKMLLSPKDSAKIHRGPGWKATITDLITGCRWEAQAADCGAGCFCAATAKLVAGIYGETQA